MPGRDIYHDVVVEALEADGWSITDDPLHLSFGGKDAYIDLGAERPIGAVKNGQRIAVEIKSFIGPSDMRDLEVALGQFCLYREVLAEIDAGRTLFLAIPQYAWKGIFSGPLGQLLSQRYQLRFLVFDEQQRRILQWIP
jgi:hypothetical protein